MGVSIIIPTLNEEGCLAESLRAARALRPHQVIVADGGSSDATRAAAAAADLFLDAPRGRAAQMNAGAARATGDALLFLHADCTLGEGALVEAERCLARPGVAAGCFRMRVRADGGLYRLIDACATARVRLTGLAYGDQGLFVTRDLFERVGGFPPLRLMEDVFLSRRLRLEGRVVVANRPIFVSPRRWQHAGLVRQTLRNWWLLGRAALGAHPDDLARYYPEVRLPRNPARNPLEEVDCRPESAPWRDDRR
jgi:rSAM/selenodomain-associated transferase 2